MRKWKAVTLSLFAIAGSSVMMSCRTDSDSPGDLESVKAWVREEFPSVHHISAKELAERLESGESPPVLLDVREEAEYEVSHLPGAIRVAPGSTESPALEGLDHDTPIVAYCSVGYRSSQLVEKLEAMGFTNVVNLEGSIFEWANEGYPLEHDGAPAHAVHPYDADWGKLLREELRAEPKK